MTTTTKSTQPTMLLTRIINAPRELVYKAWSDPKQMEQWWGPKGFTASGAKLDPKPGGIFQICMDHPDFPNHWMKGNFDEVIPNEKLVFSGGAFIDDSGEAGLTTINTVTFEDHNGKTKLTVHALVTSFKPELKSSIDGMNEGWSQTIDKLEAFFTNK